MSQHADGHRHRQQRNGEQDEDRRAGHQGPGRHSHDDDGDGAEQPEQLSPYDLVSLPIPHHQTGNTEKHRDGPAHFAERPQPGVAVVAVQDEVGLRQSCERGWTQPHLEHEQGRGHRNRQPHLTPPGRGETAVREQEQGQRDGEADVDRPGPGEEGEVQSYEPLRRARGVHQLGEGCSGGRDALAQATCCKEPAQGRTGPVPGDQRAAQGEAEADQAVADDEGLDGLVKGPAESQRDEDGGRGGDHGQQAENRR